MPNPPRPAIDDRFWFAISAKLALRLLSTRTEAAKQIQTFTGWLWTVYSAGALIGISLAQARFPLIVTILIALPSLLLILAYWQAMWAQMPIPLSFDPRSPDLIRDAYLAGTKQALKRLQNAISLSLAAGVSVAVALFLAATVDRISATPTAFDVNATYLALEKQVVVTGDFAPDTKIAFTVTPILEDGSHGQSNAFEQVSGSSGRLNMNVPLDSPTKLSGFEVSASWLAEDGLKRLLSRVIKIPATN